jgi:hypothetical protein
MSEFQLYFGLGKDHILDYKNGYDHIIFVVALCALYLSREWRQILILVTAFTIGHSVTLALSTLRVISVNVELVEFLIPLTIFVTAISNLFKNENNLSNRKVHINYLFAGLFGLIHGMGFSSYLRSILTKEGNITTPLLAFNLGLEFGQLVIVAIFMTIAFVLVDLFGLNRRDWKMVISSAIAGIALVLMNENWYSID